MKDLSRYINKVPVKVELDTSMEKILAIQLLYKQVIDVMDTIEGGSVINVKSDWNAEAGSESEILNKPALKTVATSGSYDDLSNKPTIPAAQVQSDWNEDNQESKAFILNKPTIPTAQIQSDWDQADSEAVDFIKNKPTIPTIPTNVSSFTNDAGYVASASITNIVALTQAQYEQITPDANTLYYIIES